MVVIPIMFFILPSVFAYGSGFSTQGDNDYFLFQPQITSDIKKAYIQVTFYIYFYTVNPQNGTWVHLYLETINGTAEKQIQVGVASDPHEENLGSVSQYNYTGLTDATDVQIGGPQYGKNLYAIWRNNNDSLRGTRSYKNESGVISLAVGGSTPNFFNGSSTNLSDTFAWRVAKFYVSGEFYVQVLPLQAYINDVYLKISSPLNLTFSYDFTYRLYAEPTNARLNFPIHYFLLAFIPFILVILKKRLKKTS